MSTRMSCISTAAALLALAIPTFAAPVKTIDDLKIAYRGETTAQAKYHAYAIEAAREGYPAEAGLFRAASAAEGYHARNHKRVLQKLGIRHPAAGFYHPAKTTTRENLRDAAAGESYERDSMYPQMIANANAERRADAATSETYALKAEAQHAALYTQALQTLGEQKTARTYSVCKRCGATWKGAGPERCQTCGQPRQTFLSVR